MGYLNDYYIWDGKTNEIKAVDIELKVDTRVSEPIDKAERDLHALMLDRIRYSVSPIVIDPGIGDMLVEYEKHYPLPTTWRTLDGRLLKISEMETSHICNCITHLEKRIKAKTNKYDIAGLKAAQTAMRNELKNRRDKVPDWQVITT